MEIRTSKRDIIWNYAGTLLSFMAGYIVLPFLLRILDDTSLGCWYIFQNMSNLSSLLLFGFSPSFSRNIAYCWSGAKKLSRSGMPGENEDQHDNKFIDKKLYSTVIHACRFVYFMVSLLALLLFGIVGTIYLVKIIGIFDIDSATVAWGVFLMAICMNTYFGWYTMALEGIGRFYESNKSKVFSALFRVTLTIMLLLSGYGLVGVSISFLCAGFILRLMSRKFFLKATSGVVVEAVSRKKIRECLSTIWPNTWRDGVVALADFMCLQASAFVFSFFLPLSLIGLYSMTLSFITAIGSVARSFQITQTPVLQSAFVRKDITKLRDVQSACVLVGSTLFWSGMILFMLVGIPVLRIFRPNMMIKSDYVLFLGVIQYILLIRNIYAGYISTTNRLIYWIAFIVSGIMTVLFCTLLLKYTKVGLMSIIIASFVSELMFNAWHWPMMVHKELKLSVPDLFRQGYKYLHTLLNVR